MSRARTITKFANRRLYDPAQRRYITLGDIRDLVLQKVEFSVVDRNNRRDITGRTLLQVLIEQDQWPQPVLQREVLEAAIRTAALQQGTAEIN